jgi:uncharacterized protein (DUF1778 family)
MARSQAIPRAEDRRMGRKARLGLRIDEQTKALVERAAQLEHRNLTDFCLSALAAAARQTIARHETLTLSERDRETFFEVLINPPEPGRRLRRGFAAERERIEP